VPARTRTHLPPNLPSQPDARAGYRSFWYRTANCSFARDDAGRLDSTRDIRILYQDIATEHPSPASRHLLRACLRRTRYPARGTEGRGPVQAVGGSLTLLATLFGGRCSRRTAPPTYQHDLVHRVPRAATYPCSVWRSTWTASCACFYQRTTGPHTLRLAPTRAGYRITNMF